MDERQQLCEAARSGDMNKLKTLIDSGADVSYFDGEGLTPLMHAAKHGHACVLKSLLEAGAPWNALSPFNLSAGDFAMEAGHQEAFDILLNAGTFSLLPIYVHLFLFRRFHLVISFDTGLYWRIKLLQFGSSLPISLNS